MTACTLGIVPHLVAAITGLAAVLHASGMAFEAIKVLGVSYLLWMAWRTWREKGVLVVEGSPDAVPWRAVVVSGVTVNLLNPKLTVSFFAFLPQFVPPSAPGATVRMLALSGVFIAMTFVVFVLYGVSAGLLRARVLARPRGGPDPQGPGSDVRRSRAATGVRVPMTADVPDVDAVLDEQRDYYAALAEDYGNSALQEPSRTELLAAPEAFAPRGDVLEIACGPGTWTRHLLRFATGLTAVGSGCPMCWGAGARTDPRTPT